ncbi:MAG: hypothetical protein E7Z87_07345 [Cyanobacteria bacterium SIG26]|nr:hypothetical protein [Cyanobacteria bacterium SIG26]
MSILKVSQGATSLTEKILKNKTLLNTLAKVSEHGTTFSATTALVMSTAVRPLAIYSTPDVEKENKQYAMANSICSGLIKFGMIEAVALPIEYAVKKIDNNPEKYLKSQTVKNLTSGVNDLATARSYKLLTQIIKLSTGFITAIPKSMLTIVLIPILMDKMFFRKSPAISNNKQIIPQLENGNKISFTGYLPKSIAKIIDNKSIQNFAKNYQNKDNDIPKHITVATDLLLTGSFAYQTNKSDKIKENRKKVLIYNNWISTGITIIGGYFADSLVKKGTSNIIDKFKQIHHADPRLGKYIEGINILRPAVIFAGIYYGLLPIISTYTAEKLDKYIKKHSK